MGLFGRLTRDAPSVVGGDPRLPQLVVSPLLCSRSRAVRARSALSLLAHAAPIIRAARIASIAASVRLICPRKLGFRSTRSTKPERIDA